VQHKYLFVINMYFFSDYYVPGPMAVAKAMTEAAHFQTKHYSW
jgi:hypothetical protein